MYANMICMASMAVCARIWLRWDLCYWQHCRLTCVHSPLLQAYIFGLCGPSYTVTSVEDFAHLVQKTGVATTLYQYTLVPLVPGAPHIPLCAWCHDGSLESVTTELITTCWRYLWQVCNSSAVAVVAVGHSMCGAGMACVGGAPPGAQPACQHRAQLWHIALCPVPVVRSTRACTPATCPLADM